jgi:hypothetical protein
LPYFFSKAPRIWLSRGLSGSSLKVVIGLSMAFKINVYTL